MPFPIQRFQTDRGREFFAYKVQQRLMNYGIKFRPIKPRSPHLNGMVERTQKTDLDEFYSLVDLHDPELVIRLEEWQFQFNWHHSHGALNGKAPKDKVCELSAKSPLLEDIEKFYDEDKERFQEQNYRLDLQLKQLKRCVRIPH